MRGEGASPAEITIQPVWAKEALLGKYCTLPMNRQQQASKHMSLARDCLQASTSQTHMAPAPAAALVLCCGVGFTLWWPPQILALGPKIQRRQPATPALNQPSKFKTRGLIFGSLGGSLGGGSLKLGFFVFGGLDQGLSPARSAHCPLSPSLLVPLTPSSFPPPTSTYRARRKYAQGKIEREKICTNP